MADLGTIARALPAVEQGIACAGTTLESRSYSTRKKAFLFVSSTQARLKLGGSAAEARKLGCTVGASGWVTLSLAALPATSVVKRWIAESHALALGPAPRKPEGKKRAKRVGERRRSSGGAAQKRK